MNARKNFNLPRLSRADYFAGETGTKEGRTPAQRNREVLGMAEKEVSASSFWSSWTHRTHEESGVVSATLICPWADRRRLADQRNEYVLWLAEQSE